MACCCCFWSSLGVVGVEVVGGSSGGGGGGGGVKAISPIVLAYGLGLDSPPSSGLDLILGRRLIAMMDSCLLEIPGGVYFRFC